MNSAARFFWLIISVCLGGCMMPPAPPATIIPAFEFSIGANYNDIAGVLGNPQRGPLFDRYSNLTEVVYVFPFRAVTADTRLKDGTVRSEVTDRIHLFFNEHKRLVQMTHRPNPYYPALIDMPVHRVTVSPRMVGRDGIVSPTNAVQ